MNRVELVEAIAEQSGISKKDAEKAVKSFMEVVKSEVAAGHRVTLVGFGSFFPQARKATKAFGKKVPATIVPKFTAGKAFKAMVAPKPKKRGRKPAAK